MHIEPFELRGEFVRLTPMTVHDVEGGPKGFMGVWKKEVIGGKTHLHLQGIDYQSDFVVPHGHDTELLPDLALRDRHAQVAALRVRHLRGAPVFQAPERGAGSTSGRKPRDLEMVSDGHG